ncbi:MAG: class I SAM-dependent methyltransferase [Pseudomonadota bacterium]|nr:class I SAM-dependent methyltransferase [Pseudomonadota bacterium]
MTSEETLQELLSYLKTTRYQFIAVTPATHAQVLTRPAPKPIGLRDIFGWNRWFEQSDVDPSLIALLEDGNVLETRGDGSLRAQVRVASLGDDLLLHSPFPTDAVDSVFFGPDTYRFARFIGEQLPRLASAQWLVDMGAGSGAGAIATASCRSFQKTTLVDVNPSALRLAKINAAAAGVGVETLVSDRIPDGADLVIANPPYMIDSASRSYRDGGDLLGGAVALDWAKQALASLAPGGAMLLYTGAAYVEGEAPLLGELTKVCARAGASLELTEIDPDVFGEELGQPQYERVERIAAVGAVINTASG